MLPHKTRPAKPKPNIGQFESISNGLVPTQDRAPATGAGAVGAWAVGVLAVGALAVGALAIGRLVIGRARIRRLEIDELVVGRLQVTDSVETPGTPRTGSDKAP